jgi:transposase
MTNVKKIAGFDVSKAFFDVCTIVDGKSASSKFEYTQVGLKALGKWLPAGSTCVMEATGPYHIRLAFWLHSHGFPVSVINPLVIRRFSQMRMLRAKTDKADAQLIAAFGLQEELTGWEPPAQYLVSLQQLEAVSDQLQKHKNALSNQLEAFTASGMLQGDIKKFLNREIATVEKKLQQIEEKMNSIVAAYHKQMLENLTSIPGLGKKSARVLIVISGGFTKFNNYKQLSAYIGLSPRIYQSGTSVKGRNRICKMGMARIRGLLYVCAWSAKRWNKSCKELYDRLVAQGKAKKLALIAVANKLIKQAFAIAIAKTTYDENYRKNICF